jgi:hypothetical protein
MRLPSLHRWARLLPALLYPQPPGYIPARLPRLEIDGPTSLLTQKYFQARHCFKRADGARDCLFHRVI